MKSAGIKAAIRVASLLLLFTGGCREQGKGVLSGVEVMCRRYEGRGMRPISPKSPVLSTAEAWKKSLDKHAREMGQAALKCGSVENTSPRGLTYEYHMAWEDSAAGTVVLYYFAPIHNPKGYAGYGIHAVVGIKENRLRQVCVFPVPLE
jgi:hypothetical protein